MNNTISNSQVVGIDLGTTNSVIAFYDDTGRPKIIPNADGEPKTPSCVYFDQDGSVLVGSAAWNMQLLEPERTLIEFKRGVGTEQQFSLPDGQTVTSRDCQELLKYLRQSAIRYFGDDQATAPKSRALSLSAFSSEELTTAAGTSGIFACNHSSTAKAVDNRHFQIDEDKAWFLFPSALRVFQVLERFLSSSRLSRLQARQLLSNARRKKKISSSLLSMCRTTGTTRM